MYAPTVKHSGGRIMQLQNQDDRPILCVFLGNHDEKREDPLTPGNPNSTKDHWSLKVGFIWWSFCSQAWLGELSLKTWRHRTEPLPTTKHTGMLINWQLEVYFCFAYLVFCPDSDFWSLWNWGSGFVVESASSVTRNQSLDKIEDMQEPFISRT